MRVLSNPPMSVTLGGARGNEGFIQPTDVCDFRGAREMRVLSNPPMSVTLGGTRGNEGVIQPTNVCDFEGNKGK